jgi:hypothetical protein
MDQLSNRQISRNSHGIKSIHQRVPIAPKKAVKADQMSKKLREMQAKKAELVKFVGTEARKHG